MRLPSLAAAAAVTMLAFPALAGWSGMNEQIDQTNFVVNQGCSGTLISATGLILTAKHCTTGQTETVDIEKIDADGKITVEKVRRTKPGAVTQLVFNGAEAVVETSYRTRIVSIAAGSDLALLQVLAPLPNKIVSRLACKEPERGDEVYVVGNPAGILYSSIAKGIVSSTKRSYETIRFGDSGNYLRPLMQVTAGIVGGNSGGAVYNADGELIGVPVLAHQVNEILGFAVPLDEIREFLKGIAEAKALLTDCVTR